MPTDTAAAAEKALGQQHLDQQLFRRVCGRFANGITITTVYDEGEGVHGLTANSFTSVSLAPPMVLVCIDRRCQILQYFRRNSHFGVNILGQHQQHLSDRFAGSGYDRFVDVEWHRGRTGVPLIPGGLATLECLREQIIEAGDHYILIGRVIHAECLDGEPLVYFGSNYRHLAS
jgi:flavin reductase (DIM6/NTAB) family NADH-FMN oxidoreductase RutF